MSGAHGYVSAGANARAGLGAFRADGLEGRHDRIPTGWIDREDRQARIRAVADEIAGQPGGGGIGGSPGSTPSQRQSGVRRRGRRQSNSRSGLAMKRRFVRWLFRLRLCDALYIAAAALALLFVARVTFYAVI